MRFVPDPVALAGSGGGWRGNGVLDNENGGLPWKPTILRVSSATLEKNWPPKMSKII